MCLLRFSAIFALAAVAGWADYYPSSWKYTDPDAKRLIGVDWREVGKSGYADAVGLQFTKPGPFPLPALDFLSGAVYVLATSDPGPPLVIVTGEFDLGMLRKKAAQAGLKAERYRTVETFLTSRDDILGLAVVTDRVILFGGRNALHAAIERGQSTQEPTYNPLLANGSRLTESSDFWLISARGADAFVNEFLPLDGVRADVAAMQASFSIRHGLEAHAMMTTYSSGDAEKSADTLRTQFAAFASRGGAVTVTTDNTMVRLELSMKDSASPAIALVDPAVLPGGTIVVNHGKGTENVTVAATPITMEARVKPAEKAPEKQVIRIYGLDEGTREIPAPPPL